MNKTTPLVEGCYAVNLRIYDYVGKFPKAQKAVLGVQVLTLANNLLDNILEAVYANDESKKKILSTVDLLLKKLMLFLRFSKDLSFLSFKAYESLAIDITELGKMTGGWKKWLETSGAAGDDSSAQNEKRDTRKKNSVIYTMESPVIKRYLELKLENPHSLIALKIGAFYKLFFDDARYFRKEYNFMLRNLAASACEIKIESCGFPIGSVGKYQREVENLRLFDYIAG